MLDVQAKAKSCASTQPQMLVPKVFVAGRVLEGGMT